MTLQDFANLGEAIGGIAVLITLIFLTFQIRQNTKTVLTSTRQAIHDASRSDNELILVHPHLERIYRIGRRDPTALTNEERPLFRHLMGTLFLNHEMMYLHHQHGVIDEDLWRRRQRSLQLVVSQPGVRQWWAGENVRGNYDSGFQELVESLLDNVTDQDEPAA